MRTFQLVALAPASTAMPAIAIAASRADGLGVVDLECIHDAHDACMAIANTVRYTSQQSAIRLGSHAPDFVDQVLADLPSSVVTVIFSAAAIDALSTFIARLHAQQCAVWIEVTNLDQARQAETLGADALIAKGHEAGGWVGEETTFILLQRLLAETNLPVLARGGIGLHTAVACYAAGAAGIVLDAQLALTRESQLPGAIKSAIANMDGSETAVLGTELGAPFRVYARPGIAAVERLRAAAATALLADDPDARAATWQQAVEQHVGWGPGQAWPLGQDAAFAAGLARHATVGGVLAAFRAALRDHMRSARSQRPLDADSPLARSHGTRYPVVQGPMTRVSDRAEFALRVAEGGGLPFLALALMPAPEVARLMEETQQLLGSLPWGVGILGFVPLDLRQQQMEVVRRIKPPFAIIAGGRPDQARALEQDGIATYLHVPSPGLLKLFLQDGARRFIFEGRECGGHVGPRSSFVLWNTMIETLLEHLPAGNASDCHVLFAGGIHDARSAAMVAAMAAPLAERGVRVGVLLGTAYLFTEEAVSSGAILPGFQQEAIRCQQTALVETGPGHAIRCAPTPYVALFEEQKQQLLRQGKSHDEIRQELEDMNIGRLRVASKGITRNPSYDPAQPDSRYLTLNEEQQHREGMYMIGQVAAMHDRVGSVAELHHTVSVTATAFLEQASAERAEAQPLPPTQPSRVAIIGMSCILPKANDLQTFWENVLDKVNAIAEIPRDRWNADLYFDANPRAKDKIYSRWGGFVDDMPFDPLEFGMPPNSLPSIDPMHLLALKVARSALEDAGYLQRPFDRSRTSVILGASGGIGDLGGAYMLRAGLPLLFGDAAPQIIDQAGDYLPEWTEDSFAGLLLNVAAGRIANRFDFGGLNYIVDAACASSLTAVHLAVKELETHGTDMVIVGGVDATQNPFGYLCFSKTSALSPKGAVRTFDAEADGIAISEGVVMLVLKRLEDAERDGDRIYAVIQGVGGSSDGKAKGMTAPRPEGQTLALQRAYGKAGIDPTTVGLFEAHGTGTAVGDRTEALALSQFLEQVGAPASSSAIGSVKSMIGHTKATAGVASLAKVAMALYHKVLPPTINVSKPNPKARFGEGPLYVNSETRPWMHSGAEPRRAGVSAFGFGGTNFHAVVEEYTGSLLPQPSTTQRWPSELLLWAADTRQELSASLGVLEEALAQGAQPQLADLSYTLYEQFRAAKGAARLAIITSSLAQLKDQLAQTRAALDGSNDAVFRALKGVTFAEHDQAAAGKVAFLFPGQGSQYPNMLRDLAVQFPEVREAFERADVALVGRFSRPLSSYVFPPPSFTPEEEKAHQQALTQTNVAQPALGAADAAMLRLLRELGIEPEMVAGHSYGEYAALYAAGVFDEPTLARLSEARGRSIVEAAHTDLGTMAAVQAGSERVIEALISFEDVWIANLNAPEQTIISGTRDGIQRATEHLQAHGMNVRPIAVACAFHSPIIETAREQLARTLTEVTFKAPRIPVYSNITAKPYPQEPQEITALLADHLIKPVHFVDEIETMYADGARIFIEVGPRNILTGLTQQILGQRPHTAIALDMAGRNGLTQLQQALGHLLVGGVDAQIDRLFAGRSVRRLNIRALVEDTQPKPLSPTTWMVNGSGARPIKQAGPVSRYVSQAIDLAQMTGGVSAARQLSDQPMTTSASAPMAQHHATNGSAPAQAVQQPAVATAPTMPSPTLPPAAPPAAAPAQHDGRTSVMLQFQHVMARFLETQQSVMLSYLHGGAATQAASLPPATPATVPSAVSASAAPVAQPKAVAAPVAATASAVAPEAAPPAAATPAVPQVDKAALQDQLLQIVAERTGYPAEMLNLNVDMEADLGIDSIKRVEILGALQRAVLPDDQPLAPEAMEQLASLKTLRAIVDWLDSSLAANVVAVDGHAATAPAAATPAVPQVDKAALQDQLLQIVAERTGYPAEMLNLDVDMEADLGIDSIKRVEILGALQRAVLPGDQPLAPEAMEQLASLKTLRAIVDWLDSSLGAATSGRTTEASRSTPATDRRTQAAPSPFDGAASSGAVRSVVQVAVAPPIAPQTLQFAADRTIIITEDEHGVASVLAAQIRANGGQTAIVLSGTETAQIEPGIYQTNLGDQASVNQLVALISQTQAPVGGVVHLLPVRNGADITTIDLHTWRSRLREAIKGLFHLAKATSSDLKQAAADGRAWFVAATAMGGAWGLNGPASFFPGQGGIAGLVKTLALEWPTVTCKAIDLDLSNATEALAAHVLHEMAAGGKLVEVGYTNGQRQALAPMQAPLDRSQANLRIEPDWVILITGGARGITAEVARELAQRYRPTLVLAGSSPLPDEESPDTAPHSAPQALKAALMKQMRRAGQEVSLPQVEAAYGRLLKDREMRANLEAIRQTGATVRYEQADVRDERALTDLVERIYRDYGRLDGVIHGAGVIEDKLIESKTNESFDRVFDTKTSSAFVLSRVLRPASLKFLVLFASAAGVYGNRGQSDYAAANEVLNKLAIDLDRRWPGRVVAMNWGPWAKTGMVSPEVQRQFAERGVELIPIAAGCEMLDHELRYGHKGTPEVLIAGGSWGTPPSGHDPSELQVLVKSGAPSTPKPSNGVHTQTNGVHTKAANGTASAGLPLLHRAQFSALPGGTVEVVRTLDPAYDRYLNDHQLDGKPVMPMAAAMELMAEVVQHGWSDLIVTGLRDLQVLKGIVLDGDPRTVRVIARAQTDPSYERLGVDVAVEVVDAARPQLVHYRAVVELADRLPEPPAFQPPFDVAQIQPFELSVDEAYQQWLFHGPLFKGIRAIHGIQPQGMLATLVPSPPQRVLQDAPSGQWLIDPVVFDSGLQMIILWSRAQNDMTPLPSRYRRYQRFAALDGPEMRCYLHASATPDGHTVTASLYFVGPDNRLLGVLDSLECTSSKALNRLAGARDR